MNELVGKEIKIKRDCDGVFIPSGTPILLPKGEKVTVTQALGGSFTVYVEGSLVRIASQDADALGLELSATQPQTGQPKELEGDGKVEREEIWQQLKTCYDPEIPVDIVELGLVYEVLIEPLTSGVAGNRVVIQMTLTAPGCGMGPILVQDVHDKVLAVRNVTEADVQLIWDPPWDQSRMSDEARLKLGLM